MSRRSSICGTGTFIEPRSANSLGISVVCGRAAASASWAAFFCGATSATATPPSAGASLKAGRTAGTGALMFCSAVAVAAAVGSAATEPATPGSASWAAGAEAVCTLAGAAPPSSSAPGPAAIAEGSSSSSPPPPPKSMANRLPRRLPLALSPGPVAPPPATSIAEAPTRRL
ncbi:hypothetical protein D9M72_497340 [compost metagenome]